MEEKTSLMCIDLPQSFSYIITSSIIWKKIITHVYFILYMDIDLLQSYSIIQKKGVTHGTVTLVILLHLKCLYYLSIYHISTCIKMACFHRQLSLDACFLNGLFLDSCSLHGCFLDDCF